MAKKDRSGQALLTSKKVMGYPLSSVIYFVLFWLFSIAYIILTFAQKPNAATLSHYNLTIQHYDELILPIVIFLVIIWIASFFGATMVKTYANIIKSSPDGKAFNIIGAGFMVFALSSPFMSLTSSVFNLISGHYPGVRPALTMTANYLSLGFMGTALMLIAHGAEGLSRLAGKFKPWSQSIWVLVFITFSAVYGYFLVGQSSSAAAAARAYYMPHWLVLLSVVVPYLFFWYRGLKAAENIYQYQKKVNGHLYKNALRYLAAGITLVIVSSVITRTLTTASVQINRLRLTPVLLIIYGLLIIMAAGYLFIAVGAKKLQQIEEV